jgi:hypothetical protein
MGKHLFTMGSAACLLAWAAAGAHAGVITSVSTLSLPGASTGTIGPLGATPAPNNDNDVGASPNTVPYSLFLNSPGALEVEFVTAASGGSTEYRFTQTFVNNSGLAWTGFVFELGYGVGSDFVPAGMQELDFDWPGADPTPTSTAFTNFIYNSDRIEWLNGSVPSIGLVGFTFAIDIPDIAGNRFTLRQTPVVASQTVPEPTSLLLFGGAILALLSQRRGSRRQIG